VSEWLLSREAVIAIAVLGGVLALLASLVEARTRLGADGQGPDVVGLRMHGDQHDAVRGDRSDLGVVARTGRSVPRTASAPVGDRASPAS
jgi:hypothetical protein